MTDYAAELRRYAELGCRCEHGLPVGVQEIAAMCHVKPDTVHKWRTRHGDFPAVGGAIGGASWWWTRDVLAWRKDHPGR